MQQSKNKIQMQQYKSTTKRVGNSSKMEQIKKVANGGDTSNLIWNQLKTIRIGPKVGGPIDKRRLQLLILRNSQTKKGGLTTVRRVHGEYKLTNKFFSQTEELKINIFKKKTDLERAVYSYCLQASNEINFFKFKYI